MASMPGPACPQCGSTDTTYRARAAQWDCNECDTRFVEGQPLVAAEPFCVTLANSADWVAEVANDWPGPIAHEYDRLRRLLQADQLVASVWQLKDVAEVLIRFPACVMARDVLEHGSDRPFQDEIRRVLLGPAMSMGTWQGLAQELAAHIVTHDGDGFFAPQVASLFWMKDRSSKGKSTALNLRFGELANWRNVSFGHGAFRADLTEFEGELRKYLEPLHRELGDHRDAWRGLVLQRADGTPLTGAASIVPHAPDAEPAHTETSEPLALVRDSGGELVLAPYVQLRRCTVCDCRDVFLFDWRKTDDKKPGRDKYRFIDYRAGHGYPSLWSQEKLLDAETGKLGGVPEAEPVGDAAVDADYTSNDVNAMLAERATAARYRRPEYLRRRLETFLGEQDSGTWWLRAPGHTGKSTFVSGLDPRHIGDLGEARFGDDLADLADLAVVAFYIRREYQTSPAQLVDGLTEQLKAVLNVAAGARALPQLDLDAADPGQAMVDWLEAMRAASGGRHRLLVCIDGLDELAPGAERSIVDFIPAPASLPEGLFFVVTSRPLGEMPASLAVRLPAQLRGAAVLEVGLDDPDYRALLRAYFDDRLSKRREREALDKAKPPHDFDRLFDQLLAKSDGRFLYLSYLADRLADETLSLDGLDELPSAEGLFTKLLDDIEGLHAGSPLEDLFRRILLHLAAAEAAFEEDRQQQPAVVQEIWHGLPLELLARRVEGNSDGAVSLKLAYALYTLKPALGSWKGGEGRHASFQLGLKGLAEVIGARWPDELRSLHARQAQGLIERLAAQGDGTDDTAIELDADDSWTLAHVVAHLQLGDIGETIGEEARELLDSQLRARGIHAIRELHFRRAVCWTTRRICLQEASGLWTGKPDAAQPNRANNLALLYSERGLLLDQTSDQGRATDDHGMAIAIREQLREQLGDEWSPAFAEALSTSYSYRGLASAKAGNLTRALDDYGRRIDVLERLRVQLGHAWLPGQVEQLASAYADMAAVLGDAGDSAGAMDFFSRSIALREQQRDLLGDEEWSSLRGLAIAYSNRSVVMLNYIGDPSGALEDANRAAEILQRLIQDLGEQPAVAVCQELANAYSNRSMARKLLDDQAGALQDQQLAIEILERVNDERGAESSPDDDALLAAAYMNRGVTLSDAEEKDARDEAAQQMDFGRAIDTLERLRERLGEHWSPRMAHELAVAYANRGQWHANAGDRPAALIDFGCAACILGGLKDQLDERRPPIQDELLRIVFERWTADGEGGAREDEDRAIYEDLRERLGAEWSPTSAEWLASLYTSRGRARETADLAAAREDYDRAIAILESKRERLGTEWSPRSAESLAQAYGSRGNVLRETGDLARAREDDDRAIAIYEELRERPGAEWSPTSAEWLASLYTSRGNALRGTGDLARALEDYDRAIAIYEDPRERLGAEWSPTSAEWLASLYTSRGRAREASGLARALDDYDRAIAIYEDLRERPGAEWTPDLAGRLAAAYANVGFVREATGDPSRALGDQRQALAIMEDGRLQVGASWSAESTHRLAAAYVHRGRALYTIGDLAAALGDSREAIAILDRLRAQLGRDWLPAYEDRLGMARKLQDEAAVTK
jgi:hypothetical protein